MLSKLFSDSVLHVFFTNFSLTLHGVAFSKVEDMQIGVTVALEDQEGSLKLNVLDSGCNVKGISVKLDGGASWLYQA